MQHPYWGKIFPFQDDYAYNLICSLYISNLPFKKTSINNNSVLSSLHYTNTLCTDQHSRIFQLPLSHYHKSMYANVQSNLCAKRLHGRQPCRWVLIS